MLAQLVKRIKQVESSRATNKLSRASDRATSFRSSLMPVVCGGGAEDTVGCGLNCHDQADPEEAAGGKAVEWLIRLP